MSKGDHHEITISEFDTLIITVDYGDKGRTETIMTPSGVTIDTQTHLPEPKVTQAFDVQSVQYHKPRKKINGTR
jgi:hypothetical protein